MIMIILLLFGLICCCGFASYQPNWNSLDDRPTPSWFDDAKFGIFIHFGVYSVPSWAPVGTYAEWYWSHLMEANSDIQAFHNATYGPNFKYPEFTEMFKAELFNADAWMDLFVRAGAKYVVPTSKHHEGFTLWKSAQAWNWNAVEVGPKKDILGLILKSAKSHGLHGGLYYSLYEWFHPLYQGPNPHLYVEQVMLPQWYDLINNYQPEILWCDGAWDHDSTFWNSTEFLAWLFNESPVKDNIAINDRFGSDTPAAHGGFYTSEYSSNVYLDHKWEENSGIDVHSYGFNRNTPADQYLSADYLIKLLIRTVANNGNLLLDIGPAGDGSIPAIMQDRLLQMGAWLNVNGEAIYSSRPWRVQQEGSIDNTTVRYTQNTTTSAVYAILLSWPSSYTVTLPSPIPSASTKVSMLGVPGYLQWLPRNRGITIQLPQLDPEDFPCQTAWTLKLMNVE